MNLGEYNALKIGDKVRNAAGDVGTITAIAQASVTIRWGDNPQAPTFQLPRYSTIWFNIDVGPPPTDESGEGAGFSC